MQRIGSSGGGGAGRPTIVVAGESLIDLVPVPAAPGAPLRFEALPGGSPFNCALALGRLAQTTGFMCPISADGFGDLLAAPLAAAGVTLLLGGRVAAPTTLAVVTLNAAGEARYAFHRGADRAFTRADLLAALPDQLAALQIGGFCPIREDDAEAWLAVARQAASRGAVLSIDPNVRLSLIEDLAAYKGRLAPFLALCQIVKVSEEDLEALDASLSPEDHAAALLARGAELVVVTKGARGTAAFSQAGRAHVGIHSPPVFVDSVGAGDSLMAAILVVLAESGMLARGRLAGLDAAQLEAMLGFGALVAGLNCGRKGCDPPRRDEVDAALRRALARGS